MTPRRLGSRLSLLALLLQVLATFSGMRGVVVCVEQTGRVVVEDYAAARRCRESSTGLVAAPLTGEPAVVAPPACVDTPLFGAALDQTSSSARGDGVAVALQVPMALTLAPIPEIRVIWATAPPPLGPSILRSVVLLI